MSQSCRGAYGLPWLRAPPTIHRMHAKRAPAEPTARLTARRDELADRLSRLVEDAQRATEPLVADFAEQAVQRENDDVIDRLRESTAAELQQITLALTRLADGTYGRCSRCVRHIDPARLDVVPATSQCVSCETDRPVN